jgi:hypothetical protein
MRLSNSAALGLLTAGLTAAPSALAAALSYGDCCLALREFFEPSRHPLSLAASIHTTTRWAVYQVFSRPAFAAHAFAAAADGSTAFAASGLAASIDRVQSKTASSSPPSSSTAAAVRPSAVDLLRADPEAAAFMRSHAEAAHGGPLPPRITDAELLRFAFSHGLLRATTPDARRRALVGGAAAAARTAAWLRSEPFSNDADLERFSHLIHWIPPSPDTPRPTLVVALGAAVHECRGPTAMRFANAVVTHMELGIALGTRLGDGGVGEQPEQLDVVLDASGATALGASRLAWVFRMVALTLNHHYPGRLHELALVHMPPILGWMAATVRGFLLPQTRDKFVVR